MNNSNLLLLLLITLLVVNRTHGQSEQLPADVVSRVVKPDPEAGNLGNYGNYNLNYATGQVDISFLLFELKGISINYPIALSYDHQGIKVEERATSAGMNWNLNAAGVITRTVNGLPDEKPNIGYIDNYSLISDPNAPPSTYYSPTGMNDPYYRVALGLKDLQPDIFSFSFNGRSGKFFYSPQEEKFLTMGYSMLRIEKTTSTNAGFNFLITDENGYQYFFDLKVKTDFETLSATSMNDVSSSDYSQWYLTKIVSPDEQTELEFEYIEDTNINPKTYYSYTKKYLKYSSPNTFNLNNVNANNCYEYNPAKVLEKGGSTTITNVTTHSLLISKIKTPFESLNIEYASRSDESLRIDKMKLSNSDNEEKQEWNFHHSYYTGGGKLRLDSLNLLSEGQKVYGYIFVYDSNAIPGSDSKAKDYWGFANGNTNANSLLPKIWYENQYIGDVDRTPNNNTKNGILQKIIYPTGGYTEFEYELNDYGKVHGVLKQTPIYSSVTRPLLRRMVQQGAGTSTTSFTLSSPTIVTFTSKRDNCDGLPPISGNCTIEPCLTQITLVHPDGSTRSLNGPIAQWKTIDTLLPAGTYVMKIQTEEGLDFGQVNATFYNVTYNNTFINTAGGLRIKSIKKGGDNIQSQIRKFSYRSKVDNSLSSGHVPELPVFTYVTDQGKVCTGTNGDDGSTYYFPACTSWDKMVTLTSSSNTDIFFSEGSPVVYDRVLETFGENGEGGSIDHEFYFVDERQEPIFPYSGISPNSWKRGLPKNASYYTSSGNLVKEEINNYTFNTQDNFHLIRGYKLGFLKLCPADATVSKITSGLIRYESQWSYLSSKIEKLYPSGGSGVPVVQTTSYFYDNPIHIQPTRIQTTQSDGSIRQVRIKYPQDYELIAGSSDPMLSTLYQMVQKNMIATPIEQVETIIQGGQEYVTAASLNTFKAFSLGKIYPSKTYVIDIDQPFLYQPLTLSSNGIFSSDGRFRKNVEFISYNNKGKATQINGDGGLNYSFQYGYAGLLPVFAAKNANANQIYYNGFEDAVIGSVTNAKFGKTAYSGIYAVPGNALTAGNYLVSWWQFNAGTWTYQTQLVNHNGSSAINIGNGNIIDEVCIRPPSSSISTYTFDPSIGLTSKSRDNGYGMKYDFDAMGRLRFIKDEQGNILKLSTYQIQGAQ